MMKELEKVKEFRFGELACEVYRDGKGAFFMTRQQIGQALEYVEPRKAVEKIHSKHQDRLDQFSVVTKLRTTDGKLYDTVLYSAKGVYEICRWSHQPKADAFYDQVYDLLEGLRLGVIEVENKIEHYEPKATSLGEIASYIKTESKILERNGSAPWEIAQMSVQISRQFGLSLPDNLVKHPAFEQPNFLNGFLEVTP